MPYDNPYNRMISNQIRNIDERHIDRINNISETNQYDITTPLESMTMRDDTIMGGSGFAAASAHDLGFEPTDGATPVMSGGAKRGRKKKISDGAVGAGSSGGGVSGGGAVGSGSSGGGISGGGVSGGGASGGALLTLRDMHNMQGQPAPQMRAYETLTASAHKVPENITPAQGPILNGALAGSKTRVKSRAPSARNELVRKIMKERSLNLPQASKYIKEKY